MKAFRSLGAGGGWQRQAVEVAVFLAVALLFLLFSLALLESQAGFAEARAELLELRASWESASASYGLRSGDRGDLEEFRIAYSGFRARPAVREILVRDPASSAIAAKVDKALAGLQLAELRGDPGAPRLARAFDEGLEELADRVALYARDRLILSRLLLLALTLVLGVLAGAFVLLERRFKLSREGEERSRTLSRALIAAAEGERLSVSRELHDTIAQDLAAAKLYAGLAGGPDSVRACQLLERAIGEVREMCHGLRPAELDRLGLARALAGLCEEASRSGDCRVEFSQRDFEGIELEPETEINLYRILQEALTNIRRHSGACRAFVELRGLDGGLVLRVEDDGRGPGKAPPGLGRTGMEERARLVGGSFQFGQGAAGGAKVVVALPLPPKEKA